MVILDCSWLRITALERLISVLKHQCDSHVSVIRNKLNTDQIRGMF
jgi:hypothetical protein